MNSTFPVGQSVGGGGGRIKSHRVSVEVEAQARESDSFLGTGSSIGTEQTITPDSPNMILRAQIRELHTANHTELIILF